MLDATLVSRKCLESGRLVRESVFAVWVLNSTVRLCWKKSVQTQ